MTTDELTADDYQLILRAIVAYHQADKPLTYKRYGTRFDHAQRVSYKLRKLLRTRKEQEQRDAQARQKEEVEALGNEIVRAGKPAGWDGRHHHPIEERRA